MIVESLVILLLCLIEPDIIPMFYVYHTTPTLNTDVDLVWFACLLSAGLPQQLDCLAPMGNSIVRVFPKGTATCYHGLVVDKLQENFVENLRTNYHYHNHIMSENKNQPS